MNIPKNLPWLIVAAFLALACMGAVYDNTGKEMVNASGSTVAVTNSITATLTTNGLAQESLQQSGTNLLAGIKTQLNGGVAVTNSVFVTAIASIPVTGQVAQTGVWTMQPGNTANTTAWLVNVTNAPNVNAAQAGIWDVNDIIGTVSLPSGASTSALQQSTTNLLQAIIGNQLPSGHGVNVTNAVTIGTMPNVTINSGSSVSATNIVGFATDAQLANITNRQSAAQATLDGLTNNVRGAYNAGLWLPSSAAVASNLISSSATRFRGAVAFNTNINAVWLKLYSGSAAGTPSANTPIQSWLIPADIQGRGFVIPLPGAGISLPSGGWLGVTGGRATNDNTAPVGLVDVNYWYD